MKSKKITPGGDSNNTVVSRRCICCGIEIKYIYDRSVDKRGKGIWLNGMVDIIAANYGSEHDGDIYVVALCDGCVRTKMKDGTIELY
jgi:hypothetical protein